MTTLELVADTSPVLGSITPRLFTQPLVTGPAGPCGCGCALTEDTTDGFAVVRFAEQTLGMKLYPWQRWLVIHALELLPSGRLRFRRIVVTVARQSGKTELLIVLALYWLFIEQLPSIFGTSTLTKYAKKPWKRAYDIAMKCPDLRDEMPTKGKPYPGMKAAAGEEEWWTAEDCHYAIAASNAEGGRSMTNHRVIADELAKQYNYDAYSAAYYSMNAVVDAQYWGLTTPDPKGIVYNDLRDSAISFIENGVGDKALGLFEWSAEEDADPLDPVSLAQSNPNLGRVEACSVERLLSEAEGAVAKGGEMLITFKTEVMCIQVKQSNPAIDFNLWKACHEPGDLTSVRDRVAMCFDVSTNMQHATLYAAAVLDDGRVRVHPVEEWVGTGCADRAARALPAIFNKMKVKPPRVLGYLPSGPAASVMAAIESEKRGVWPPRGTAVQAIKGEMTAVCMGFEQLVSAGQVVHDDDPLLNDHVEGAEKLNRGDAWVFSRKNPDEECDAVYAAAGAAHLARTLPAGLGKLRVIGPSES